MDPLTIAMIASSVLGGIGNIMSSSKQGEIFDLLQKHLGKIVNMTPQQLAGMLKQLSQPMSQNLENVVLQHVQATMAERGLGGSPGLMAEATAQGLAPYEFNEQALASQNLMQLLGMPFQLGMPGAPKSDLSGIANMLGGMGGGGGGSTSGSLGGWDMALPIGG
jgi:hypothetical protein